MRKLLLLGAAALMVPSVALADGEDAAPMSPMFVGVSAGWTTMDMPEHQNGASTIDFGSGFEPMTEQADVDGVTYAFGLGKDLASGWRVGAYGRFFDGEGSSSSSFAIPGLTPARRGRLDGTLELAGLFAPTIMTQTLDVDVTDYAVAVSAGHGLGDILRADMVVSYGATDTEYRNLAVDGAAFRYITNTTFSSNTVEIAARLGAGLPLSDDFTLSVGGSAGWGLRNVDMNARQQVATGAGVLLSNSTIGLDQDVDGFIGRFDAAFGYNIARSTSIALTANYVYDDMVPVYVAPVYPPAGVGTAATFTTEGQSSMTYGVRLLGRF